MTKYPYKHFNTYKYIAVLLTDYKSSLRQVKI